MGQNTRDDARTPGSEAMAIITNVDATGKRDYSKAEQTAIVLLATLVGVAEAARVRDVPASTIYTWLAKVGGAEALRTEASAVLASTQFGVAIEICLEIRKRLPDMSDAAVLDALRAVGGGARSPLEGQTPSGATAHAGAIIQVLIQGKDGAPDEVIEVVRPKPQEQDADEGGAADLTTTPQASASVTAHVSDPQQP